MTGADALPLWAALIVSALVLTGAALALVGSIGLLRLSRFYDRVHAPTMGTTLGTGCVLLASMALFSVLGSRAVLHEILIGLFMTVTTPVTFMLLVRATLHRESNKKARQADAGDGGPPASV